MHHPLIKPARPLAALAAAIFAIAPTAFALDIEFVQPAALDQPRINAYLRAPNETDPRNFDGTFNIQAFFDTGASGVLLSNNTAAFLNVTPDTFNGQEIIFSDVGVAGSDDFHVSKPLFFGLAPYHPNANVDDIDDYPNVYTQTFTNIRAQVGPVNQQSPNPLLEDLDVFGIPLMQGKVVVMDPRPVDSYFDTMRTYVYNPNTPFRPDSADSDPGIPTVNANTTRHIKMTYAGFDRFTTTTPAGAPTASLADNPFIGPHPLAGFDPSIPPGNTPGIKIGYNGRSAEGSWLFDTGAAASILSEHQAGLLGVSYQPGTKGTDNPILAGVPQDEQFQLTIGGIGGTTKVSGFFLDSMLLRSEEGNPSNDNDPAHIRFMGAPVLVGDITLRDPATQRDFTLDGILGMNFFVASAFVTEAEPFPIIDSLTPGNFDWVVFDQPRGKLILHNKTVGSDRQKLTWAGTDDEFTSTWYTRDFSFFFPPNFVTDQQQVSYFKNGDLVTFGDAMGDKTVYIQLDVMPGGFTVDTDEQYTFTQEGSSARIRGPGGMVKTGTGTLTMNVPNDYKGPTELLEGTTLFTQPQNIGQVYVRHSARARFETSQKFQGLHVADSALATVPAGNNKLIVTRELEITAAGKLDLADNAMVIHVDEIIPGNIGEPEITAPGVLNQIHALLARGRANGSWTGSGLTSSTAAADPLNLRGPALFLNRDAAGNPIYSTFRGEALTEDSILIMYTWLGDLDLNGIVDLTDYATLRDGYLTGKTGYQFGDIDYSGDINLDDLLYFDRAFLNQAGTMPSAPTPVPEPAAISAIVLTALLLKRRRAQFS